MVEQIFGKPIITQEDMQRRIKELGKRISIDYEGKDLLMVGVLKGAFAFFADLVRAIRLPLRIDFIIVSSYGLKTKPSGRVKVISDLREDIAGQDVLLVEDIVDSGLTVNSLKKSFLSRRPKSLRVCALLDKAERRKIDVGIDYVGFKIPNKYVVGYGLDYQDKYRNLPYLAVLENVEDE